MEQRVDRFDIASDALVAQKRIAEYARETPLEYSPYLSRLGNCHVYLKLENYQVTGSFKYRGAANHILSLSRAERNKGVVTASTGNHALAFAHLLGRLGIRGTIYMPENVSKAKLEALESSEAEIRFYGTDCVKTETFARNAAYENGQTYVPPYNHPKIIAGQATVAVELERQLGSIDAVLVPVGGGGLIAGIAGYVKRSSAKVRVVACQPEASPVMYESVKRGRIVEIDSLPTLSDGTAGGIERGSVTYRLCEKLVDEYVLVSEDEIRDAIALVLEKHNLLIEGAAALPVASLVKLRERFTGKNVVIIITGRRIGLDILRTVVCNET
jgi:threonine dehydratase